MCRRISSVAIHSIHTHNIIPSHPHLPPALLYMDRIACSQQPHSIAHGCLCSDGGCGGSMRPPQLFHTPLSGCQDVGGFWQGPCRRCSECSLLPLRHSAWEGEESPVCGTGFRALRQGPKLDCGLPLWHPVQTRHCRPRQRGLHQREEPTRRIPFLAPKRKLASFLLICSHACNKWVNICLKDLFMKKQHQLHHEKWLMTLQMCIPNNFTI